jgi:hypothetical protein
VQLLELGRRHVTDGAMEEALVPPLDPSGGDELQFVDGSPGRSLLDHLGLIKADDALGQRVRELPLDQIRWSGRRFIGDGRPPLLLASPFADQARASVERSGRGRPV